MTYTILIVLLWVTVHAIRKAPARAKRPRLEYKPEWYQREVIDLEEFTEEPEAIEEPKEPEEDADTRRNAENERQLARADIERWEALKLDYIATLDACDAEMSAMPEEETKLAELVHDLDIKIADPITQPAQVEKLERQRAKVEAQRIAAISRNRRRVTTLTSKRAATTSKIASLDRLIEKAYATANA